MVLLIAVVSSGRSPLIAALAVEGIALTAGMLLSPVFAVNVLCFSIPFERLGRLTSDADAVAISLSRILGIIVLASLLLHVGLRKQKLRFGRPFFLYCGYTAVALLSYTWAYSPEETFRDGFRVLGNLIFFFLIVNLIRTYASARTAVIVWLAASMCAGVYSLVDYYYAHTATVSEAQMDLTSNRFSTVEGDAAEIRSLGKTVLRMFGPTAHPTLFGMNMTMTVPFFIWALRVRRKLMERALWAAGLMICSVCIFLSNTRAVMLLLAFTLIFCLARGLLRLRAQAAVGLVVVGIVVAAFIPQDVWERSLDFSLYSTSRGDSLRVRFKFWEKSWGLVQESWPIGIGLGDQTTLLKRVTDEKTGYLTSVGARASAHNEYIWVLVEVGVLGSLFHWWFVGAVTASSFRAGRLFRQQNAAEQYLFAIACQTVMIGVLLFAMQSEAFHYPLKSWWLLAAISYNLAQVASLRPEAHPELPLPAGAAA
jgi:hypothetical protein